MARYGLSKEQREKLGHGSPNGPPVIQVLERNVPVLHVYRACLWDVREVTAGKQQRLFHRGIASTEIKATMWGLDIPREHRRRVYSGVRFMAATAAPLLNGTDV